MPKVAVDRILQVDIELALEVLVRRELERIREIMCDPNQRHDAAAVDYAVLEAALKKLAA